jgi:hypothetical protein
MCLFERLPQQILNDIALHLDNRDLVSLCLTSHTNKNKIKSEDFWKR